MKDIVLSLYDYTGVMVKPWAESGYECHTFDIQHDNSVTQYKGGGSIHRHCLDLHNNIYDIVEMFKDRSIRMVFGFPVCTDLAVSGAAHFANKAKADPLFQTKAVARAKAVAILAERLLGTSYMIENPVSVLATQWRKPDFYFQPYEYGGYIDPVDAEHPLYPAYIAPRDAYSKKTGIWSGGNFKRPTVKPVECESFGKSRQHSKLGGKSEKTKNIRSATPRGFAQAVFEANR